MAKEIKVDCDFIEKSLICELPPQTLDVLLRIRTRSGEHTFREDVYTRSLKYRRWNNQMRPFRSLKKRVANIFRRRRSTSNDSWGDSTQTIINWEEEDEVQSETNSSMSDWSDNLLVNSNDREQPSTSRTQNNLNKTEHSTPKRTEKNLVLVPFKPKPKNWGSWRNKTNSDGNTKITEEKVDQNLNDDVEYVPDSPHYSPVHSPQFYEKGIN